jgi:hypothetical protein
VDNLNDAMAVSQQLLDAGWMDEDEDYSNIILEPEG